MTFENDTLNPVQLDAVENYNGPTFVVAGPGSGKTRVLTHRIAEMLNAGVDPQSIIAVTFTNKAAKEIRRRLYEGGAYSASEAWIGTFHDICRRFLRLYGNNYTKTATVIDRRQDFKIFENVLKSGDLAQAISEYMVSDESSTEDGYVEAIEGEAKSLTGLFMEKISRYKSRGLYFTDLNPKTPEEVLEKEVYRLYQESLLRLRAMSYDDILLYTYKLFSLHESARRQLQEMISYVLVDEAQDSNWVQIELAEIWAAKTENICFIGDLDQSIYAWRGAVPEEFEGFLTRHPSARVVRLEENYRSNKNIVNLCRVLIASNPSTLRGEIFSSIESDVPVRIFEGYSQYGEADWIAQEIKKWLARGKSCAVLLRSSWQTQPIERAFRENNISYRVVGGIRYYDRPEIQDALAWLGFLVNPLNRIAFENLLGAPVRGLGPKRVGEIFDYGEEHRLSPEAAVREMLELGILKGAVGTAWQGFLSDFDAFRTIVVQNGIEAGINYLNETLELAAKKYAKTYQVSYELLKNFASDAAEFFSNNPNTEEVRKEFVENAALSGAADEEFDVNQVPIATCHSVKGLEFDCVIVAGVEDGLLPHYKSTNAREERRLLYVACSRAREELAITYARGRLVRTKGSDESYLKDTGPSRFLTLAVKNAAQVIKSPEPPPRAYPYRKNKWSRY
jgi:DNA helicase-2/ATP-dependent DNA helicase PcrA